jgi:Domain of unknown function (DUF5134)
VAGRPWLADALAVIMIVTAVYCASRLVVAAAQRRATEHDVDLVHIVMGVAMAGMLVPRINPLWSSAWAVVFGAATAWFGWRVFRGYRLARPDRFAHAHHVPHLVMSGAMVYMLSAASRPGPGAASPGLAMGASVAGGARFPLAALVLAIFMVGYVVWVGDRLPALATVRAWVAGPAMAAAMAAAAGLDAPGLDASGSQVAAVQEAPARSAAALRAPVSPRLAACCEIIMGITMGYMLILML